MERVVCTHNWTKLVQSYKYQGEVMPITGEIYTVRETMVNKDGTVGFRLVEIINTPRHYMRDGFLVHDECTFDSRAFRAIDNLFGEEESKRIEEYFERLEPILVKLGYI